MATKPSGITAVFRKIAEALPKKPGGSAAKPPKKKRVTESSN